MAKLKPNEYQCENCKEIYTKTWTDEEAMAETEHYFGEGWQKSELAIICDDCFQKMHPAKHPDLVKQSRKAG